MEIVKHRLHLPALLKKLGLPMRAAEIGVASGFFSRDLLTEGIELLYSIDNWTTINGQKGDGGFDQNWHDDNYQSTVKLLEPFGEKSIILRGMSAEMSKQIPDNSLGLIHLDGDHSYAGVVADLYSFFPKLVSGGIMSGHDFLMSHYGVERAVTEFTNRLGIKVHVIKENKPEDAGFMFYKP